MIWIIEHAKELRIDLNVKDCEGRAFIHLLQYPEEFEVLLRSRECTINALDSDGRTPLEYAIKRWFVGLANAFWHHWPCGTSLPAHIFLATTEQAWCMKGVPTEYEQWKKLAIEMYQSVYPHVRFAPIDLLDDDAVLRFGEIFSTVKPLPWVRCRYYQGDKGTLFEAILDRTMRKIEIVRGLLCLKNLLDTSTIQVEDLVSVNDGSTALHVFASSDIGSLVQGATAVSEYANILLCLINKFQLDPDKVNSNGKTAFDVMLSKKRFAPTSEAKVILETLLSPKRKPSIAPEPIIDTSSEPEDVWLAKAIEASLAESRGMPQHYCPHPSVPVSNTHNASTSRKDEITPNKTILDEEEIMIQYAIAMSMQDK